LLAYDQWIGSFPGELRAKIHALERPHVLLSSPINNGEFSEVRRGKKMEKKEKKNQAPKHPFLQIKKKHKGEEYQSMPQIPHVSYIVKNP